MTLVRNRENKKIVISHKSPGFNLPFINKSYPLSSEKDANIHSGNMNFTRLTSSLRYLLKHNGERKKHTVTNHDRSNISRKKRNLFAGSPDFDLDIPGSLEKHDSKGVFPSAGEHICNMDYQKVSVNPPGYRSKPFFFK